jgi:Glycosyl hydrolases family 35/Beta-galactosidase, domain 2/Beta-galactosidase second all-beta domain
MRHSRRRFLKSALAAPLGAALGPDVARLLALAPAPQAGELFPNPHVIHYDASCFTLHDKDSFIYSAAFHYPRCPQALWRDRLSKLKQAGYNTLETYVFWNYHEPQEGRADLSEFEAFIQLVKEMGFWMIARPGPYVCAEWDSGGFPRWVIAKQFPLRSNDPQSVSTSEHWFSAVMPVIVPHQITHGGPIVMVQIENEYDYWAATPPDGKRAYVRALAEAAWNQGVDVPLITCWTKEARENTDATMARIMDTCNFYPRWNILKEVPPALAKLRREETTSPLGITELQGGWFSQFGGKLSVDQEGVSAAQYNFLVKTAIEQGVTYLSTYMAFGGTNFDWAAKGLTTTYDYAAPLREPGGLGEKFYAARGIGATLSALGEVLARAKRAESGVECTNANVTVTLRENGARGALFIREDAGSEQRFKMVFPDPSSPTHRPISVPRQGELEIGPHEMKMLPVQLEIPGGALRYSTGELLTYGESQERQFLILYDEPGRLVEVGLATRNEPHIEGDTVYQYWDPEFESVVFGVRVENAEKLLLLNNHLMVVLLPRKLALGTWTAEFPQSVIPGPFVTPGEQTTPISVPFFSDAALLGQTGKGERKYTLWAELFYRPGEHSLTAMLPPVPSKCLVDGAPADIQYERPWHTARVHVSTPAIPAAETVISNLTTWTEKFDPSEGKWSQGAARPLDEFGLLPYGYVKYRAEFSLSDTSGSMFIRTLADDGKRVFLNGKLVPAASVAKKQVEFPLANLAQAGTNTLEIAYELFGNPNFGPEMSELKGVESVGYGADAKSATLINSWQIQRYPAPIRGRELDPEYSYREWKPTSLDQISSSPDLVPAFTWCRAEFNLSPLPENWWLPWKLDFDAQRDALLYLNGKFLGRYVTAGPQNAFYIPESYLTSDSKRQNVLTVVLAYAGDLKHIRTLRVEPYEEFALHRTRLELEW